MNNSNSNLFLTAPCVVPSVSQGTVIPIEQEIETNVTTSVPVLSSNKVKHGTALEVLCNEHYEFPVKNNKHQES